MHDLLMRLVPWGVQVIVSIQTAAGTSLDGFFRLITSLGADAFLLVLLLPLLWCTNKQAMLRLIVLFLFSGYLNAVIKEILAIPRPFVVSAAVQAKTTATGYSFPSGHAQTAATLWPTLALTFRRRWLTVLAIVLVILISFSRVYLGVHYPQDIIAGIVLGLLIVWLSRKVGPLLEGWFVHRSLGVQLALAVAVPLLAMLSVPSVDALTAAGTMMGLGVGAILERQWLDFEPIRRWPTLIAQVLVGLAVVGAIYLGLSVLAVGDGQALLAAAWRVTRYACLGLGGALVCPWLFVRLGLARRGQAGGPV